MIEPIVPTCLAGTSSPTDTPRAESSSGIGASDKFPLYPRKIGTFYFGRESMDMPQENL